MVFPTHGLPGRLPLLEVGLVLHKMKRHGKSTQEFTAEESLRAGLVGSLSGVRDGTK